MRFLITCDVERARGTQCWTVEADSESEAIRKFRIGEGEFYDEEVEVTSIGAPIATPFKSEQDTP